MLSKQRVSSLLQRVAEEAVSKAIEDKERKMRREVEEAQDRIRRRAIKVLGRENGFVINPYKRFLMLKYF